MKTACSSFLPREVAIWLDILMGRLVFGVQGWIETGFSVLFGELAIWLDFGEFIGFFVLYEQAEQDLELRRAVDYRWLMAKALPFRATINY